MTEGLNPITDDSVWRRAHALLHCANGSQHIYAYVARIARDGTLLRPLTDEDFTRIPPTRDWWEGLTPERQRAILHQVETGESTEET